MPIFSHSNNSTKQSICCVLKKFEISINYLIKNFELCNLCFARIFSMLQTEQKYWKSKEIFESLNICGLLISKNKSTDDLGMFNKWSQSQLISPILSHEHRNAVTEHQNNNLYRLPYSLQTQEQYHWHRNHLNKRFRMLPANFRYAVQKPTEPYEIVDQKSVEHTWNLEIELILLNQKHMQTELCYTCRPLRNSN